MKQLITSLKSSSLSFLAITTLTAAVSVSATSSVQAAEFKSVSGAMCTSKYPDVDDVDHTTWGAWATNDGDKSIYCPLQRDKASAGQKIRVFLNYQKKPGSTMSCTLFANKQDPLAGVRWQHFALYEGKWTAYAEVTSFHSGAAVVKCVLKKKDDAVFSLNFQTL